MIKRPQLMIEKAATGEMSYDEIPKHVAKGFYDGSGNPIKIAFPHCDNRILHASEDCKYCAECIELQKERADLNVSNTGKNNRWWPCPGDRDRTHESLNAWPGNRPKK